MLYANTDEGSSALWVLDGNGVVVDNISYSIADRATILAQINEHYGTSFTGWSDNEIGLRIGDTLTNWNAYEKIEMPEPKKVAVWLGNGYVIGQVSSNKYMLSVNLNNNNAAYMILSDGIVNSEQARSEGLDNYIISKIVAEYPNVNQIVNDGTRSYQIGETVEDWSEYEKIQ